MAEFKLGRIKFVFQGVWQASHTYVADDVVTVGGKSYICVVGHSSSPAFVTDFEDSTPKWNLMADGVQWIGDWSTNHYYNDGDLVRYDGIVYVCNQPHQSNASATSGLEADSGKWDPFVTSFFWKGNWASTTRYKLNDVVTYGADLWICTTYHTSSGTTIDQSKFTILVNGLEFINSWSNSTNYVKGDLVTYGGYTYVAVDNHSGQNPSTTAHWTVFTTGFNFRGDWTTGSYKIGDVVRLGGYTYLATADNPGGGAYIPPNLTYWTLLNPGLRWTAGTTTYTGISGTNLVGTGSSATFDIVRSNTVYTVTKNAGGSGYNINDTIKILGTQVGGISPVNDIVITVSGQTSNAITSVTWTGTSSTWVSGTDYKLGDLVFWGANSYICVTGHTAGTGSRPDNDTTGTYWNTFVFGTEQAVMTTQGDMFYYGANGAQRLPIGIDGQVLKVVGATPTWSNFGVINNVVYVGPAGTDTLVNGQGLTIDKPWNTILYATQKIEDGYLNTNATALLAKNKQFILKEVNNYVSYTFKVATTGTSSNAFLTLSTAGLYLNMPISFVNANGTVTAGATYYVKSITENTSFTISASLVNGVAGSRYDVTGAGTNTGSYVYSTTKTERDTGIITDAVVFDIGHGGTQKTTAAALSYFAAGGTSYVSGVNANDITAFVSALNYMVTVAGNILANAAPAANYQTLNGISLGNQAKQIIDSTLTAESSAPAALSGLVSIITTGLTGGTTSYIPPLINPNTTISIKTGTYNEFLPIVVPANTALVGDELRSTVVQPAQAVANLATDKPKSIAALKRIQSLVPTVMANSTVTPTSTGPYPNTQTQVTTLPAGDIGSTTAVNSVATNAVLIQNILNNGLNQVPAFVLPAPTGWSAGSATDTAYATTTGSNLTGATTGYANAVTQIQQNYLFIKAEIANYLNANYSSVWTTFGATNQAESLRDIGFILDAIVYDLTYGGNTQTLIAGSAYYSLSVNQILSTYLPSTVGSIGRLKTIITQVAQGVAVSTSAQVAPYVVSQVGVGAGAGSAASGGFAQDRVQDVLDWINNSIANATVAPYTTWPIAALQTSFATLQGKRAEIASDAQAWVYRYYHTQNISPSLTQRDAGFVVDALSYDLLFGSNFASITAGRAYQRPIASDITLLATELAATSGAIGFISQKAKHIAGAGSSAQVQTTIDGIVSTINGNVSSTAVFVGSISGTLLSITSVTSGTISAGMVISGVGIAPGTTIVSGAGSNWIINYSQAVTSVTTTISAATISSDATRPNQITMVSTSGMVAGLQISITGTTIANLSSGNYYILSVVDSTHVTLSSSFNGSVFTITSTGSGTMSATVYGVYNGLALSTTITGKTTAIPVTAVATSTNLITVADTTGMSVDMPVVFSGLPSVITTTASATTVTTNVITLGATASSLGILAGQKVYFTGAVFGNISASQMYYVISPSGSTIQISLTSGGSAVSLATASGTMNVYVNNAGGLVNGNTYWINAINNATTLTLTSGYKSGSVLAITNSVSGMTATASVGKTAETHGSLTYNNTLTTIQGAEVLRANANFLAYEALAYIAATYGGLITTTTATTDRFGTGSAHNLSVGDPVIFTGTSVSGSGITIGTQYWVLSVPTTTTFTLTTTQNGTIPVNISVDGSGGTMTVSYYMNSAKVVRDAQYYLNSIIYDLNYTGNYKAQRAAKLYLAAQGGSSTSDMFYLRNSTGVRNMTLNGLVGSLTALNAYNTKRPTAGAYSSLDPGFGPNDSNAWISTRSPYTQNCTMFGSGCTGVKIDGALHAGGNRSIVANDYTTILSDGIGAWCTGSSSLTELVSVFCYYSYSGYLAELGGRIRATNGNSSYGTYGVVAEGVDTYETPLYGALNNRYFQAQITNTVTDATDKILRLEYGNAGSAYSNTVTTISGAGYNATTVQDEFRDSSVFETRIIDKNDGTGVGGTNYVTISNASQGGTTGNITIAATDLALTNAYNYMRIQVTAGTGVGQYANILNNNNGSKVALIYKDSFTPLSITQSSTTVFTVASTATLYAGMPIYLNTSYAGLSGGASANLYYVQSTNFTSTQFSVYTASSGGVSTLNAVSAVTVTVTATSTANNLITGTNTLTAGQIITFNSSFNGIVSGVNYYVLAANLTGASFSVSLQPTGTAVTITATGSVSSTGTVGTAVFAAGWDHTVPGTTIVNAVDLTTNYIIEPRIVYTGPGFATSGSITTATTAAFTGLTYGAGRFVGVASGGTVVNYSTNGSSWTAGGALPSSQTWGDVAYLGGQGATATAVVGGLGGSGAVLTAVIGTGLLATQIVSVTIVNGGINYLTPPTIVFTPTSGGIGATATATVLNGAITSVTMTINGSGYLAAPTVSAVTSQVSSVTVNSWGKNYYGATPLVSFDYPAGLSPTAWIQTTSVSLNAYLVTVDGNIYKVTVAGTTGSSKPTHVTGSAGNGGATLLYVATQAAATPVLTNYGISGITVTNAGYGYTTTPTVTITDSNAKFIAISTASTNTAYNAPTTLSTTWTAGGALGASTYKAIATGGGYATAVGGASGTGVVASTTDGITWTTRTAPALSAGYWSTVAYSAGGNTSGPTWLAVNNGGLLTITSINSVSWVAGGNLPAGYTTTVSSAYGNGRFVVLGSDGKVAYSKDFGTTWSPANTCAGTTTSVLSSSLTWVKITYGQGLFLAIASGTATCATSPDGINWTIQAGTSAAWSAVTFGNPTITSTVGPVPMFMVIAGSAGASARYRTGATAVGRVKVASGLVTELRMLEPGSGYPKGVVTATTTSTNVITTNDTTNLANNMQVEFIGCSTGGLAANTVYYVIGSTIVSNTSFKVSLVPDSSTAVTLSTATLTGSYRATATATIIDSNHVINVSTRQRQGDGALGNPSFTNRGTGNTTATSSTLGDGYSDLYQPSSFVNVGGIYAIPTPGANIEFASIPNTWFKLVAVTNILGIPGNYTAQFQINPALTVLQAPANGDLMTTRLKYSQVRLTGHDFLYVGTGNASNTNYPYVNPANASISNQELASGGGRVFFTSTDQDGNFNVGNLFGVQQSTGTATLNASAFNLAGLQSLQLGAVTLGVGSAIITQFSTDPYFTANSDSVVPTQKAIRSYITSQIGGGQSTLNVNTITSGVIYIANNTISTTTGVQIIVNSKMNFTGGIDGAPVAQAFFMQK